MLLIESNIYIYAILPEHKALRDWMIRQDFATAEITLVEVLGYHQLKGEEAWELEALFNMSRVLPMSRDIVDKAIELRRLRKMGLADSLIAATALEHKIPLITRNTSDYDWIEGLDVRNPM